MRRAAIRVLPVGCAAILAGCATTASPDRAQLEWFEALAGFHEVSAVPSALRDLARRAEPRAGDEVTYELTLDRSNTSERWQLRFVVIGSEVGDDGVDRTIFRVDVTDTAGLERSTRELVDTQHLTTGLFTAARVLDSSKLTPEDGVAFGRSIASLLAIIDVIQRNDELAPILWEIVERPSIWSILTNGIEIEMHVRKHKPWTAEIPASAGQAYRIPISLDINGQPALHVSVVVVEPRAPISTGAGILTLVAERPDASGRRARMRLLDARLGTPVSDPAARKAGR